MSRPDAEHGHRPGGEPPDGHEDLYGAVMRTDAVERAAVVTGATSGIGAAVFGRLVQGGMRSLGVARREERLRELQARHPGRAFGHAGDLRAPGLMADVLRGAEAVLGVRPDVFVLAAGHGLPGTLLTSDPARWGELLELNCLGLMHQLRACAAYCLEAADTAPAGVQDIVVIGSTIGRQVSAFNPVYGSTKFAVHSLVEALRQEVCGSRIRVTLIEPGFVKTEFQEAAGYDAAWFGSLERDMGPFLDGEDVARTIEFVVGQPPHVHLDDIRIRPTRQRV